jgi:hypothetical protein
VTAERAKMPLDGSAFDGGFNFTVTLPPEAAYKPDGTKRDFSHVEGLLGYVCEMANALRQSVGLPELQRFGQQLTDLLQAAVDEMINNPSDEFLADIGARFEKGVRWDRRLERAPGGAAFRQYAHTTSSDGFYALLAVMLMHPKYRQLVRRCPQCGNFFVRDGKQIFCTKECTTAANDAGVVQRQKNQRLRRKALALLTGASPARRADAVKQAQKDHPDATPEKLAEHAKRLLRPNLFQRR